MASHSHAIQCPHPACRRAIMLPCDRTNFIKDNKKSTTPRCLIKTIAWGHCPNCDQLVILIHHGIGVPSSSSAAGGFDETPETVAHPKPASRHVSDANIPERMSKDFNEAAAISTISPKASAALTRRLLQDIFHNHYKIKGKNLSQEIDIFIATPSIPKHLSDAVDAIRNIGNFAAHPLKDTSTGDIIDVEPGEADWLLDVIEALFDYTYIQPASLTAKRAALNAKLKAAGKPALK